MRAPAAAWLARAGIAVCALAAVDCRTRTTETTAYVDSAPAPAEPLVTEVTPPGRYGGRLVVAAAAPPHTFNPLVSNSLYTEDLLNRLFVSLTRFDTATQVATPYLAMSWERAADGLTWTFHLRRGAAFSDGRPLTSADVVFSFTATYTASFHPAWRDTLSSAGVPWTVTAADAQTVTIRTARPNAIVPELLVDFYILPRHVLEPKLADGTIGSAYGLATAPAELVTSGPWRLHRYAPGERTVLRRNPFWFGTDQTGQRLPYLDELVMLAVPDQDAADLKFRAGEVDGLSSQVIKPDNYAWYEQHQQQDGFTLHTLGPTLSSTHLWFNLSRARTAASGRVKGDPMVGAVKYAWFANPVFRRAVAHAIDHDAIIRSVFSGHAVQTWSLMTPGSLRWHLPDVPQAAFNRAEAARLLAGLGWKDSDRDGMLEDAAGHPVRFSLEVSTNNRLRVAIANFVRDDLARLGLGVTLVPLEFNTTQAHFNQSLEYDAAIGGLSGAIPPDPAVFQNTLRSSGTNHRWNPGQVSPATPDEAQMDRLMDVLVEAAAPDARLDAWRQIARTINAQALIIWLPAQVMRAPIRNGFGNLRPSPFDNVVLRNIDATYSIRSRTGD